MEHATRETIYDELNNFEKKKPFDVPAILEDYLMFIAKTGDTIFPWAKLKPLFKCKMDRVIKKFKEDYPADDLPYSPNMEKFNFEDMHTKLVNSLEDFTGAPFTIQRLCELVVQPDKHYKRVDKFLRALEKDLLVVTTVEPVNKQPGEEDGSCSPVVNGVAESSVNGDNAHGPNKKFDQSFGDMLCKLDYESEDAVFERKDSVTCSGGGMRGLTKEEIDAMNTAGKNEEPWTEFYRSVSNLPLAQEINAEKELDLSLAQGEEAAMETHKEPQLQEQQVEQHEEQQVDGETKTDEQLQVEPKEQNQVKVEDDAESDAPPPPTSSPPHVEQVSESSHVEEPQAAADDVTSTTTTIISRLSDHTTGATHTLAEVSPSENQEVSSAALCPPQTLLTDDSQSSVTSSTTFGEVIFGDSCEKTEPEPMEQD